MDKQDIINLIASRIANEQRKHMDYTTIAAAKIYSQWFEYFDNEISELTADNAKKDAAYAELKQLADEMASEIIKYYDADGSITITSLLNSLTNYQNHTK